LVLIIMIVLFMLGAVLLQYASTEVLQVSRSEKRMQAYYLARSGAEAMAEHLIANPSDVANYEGKDGSSSISDSNGEVIGQITVSVDDIDGKIIIESKGQVDDNGTIIEELLTLSLNEKSAGLFEDAIFSYNTLNVSGMREVFGDISSNEDIIVGGTDRGEGDMEFPYQDRFYPEPEFPDEDKVPGNGTVLNADQNDETINQNMRYTSIKNKNQSTIYFNTTDGDLYIIVEGEIEIKGTFEIMGPNKVFLFLDGTGEMKTNNVYDYDPNQLFVLLKESSDLTIKTGQREFGGFIYGPNADITLWSNAEVKGAIVANNFSANGNPSLDSRDINYDDYLDEYVEIPTLFERDSYSR